MSSRQRRAWTSSERDEAADRTRACELLARLADLLRRIDHPRTGEVEALLATFTSEPTRAWRELDGNAWWAGAGSLAAESLVEPVNLPTNERAGATRAFRALLSDIAELLRGRGPTNPGLSSWLLAFRNWEGSGV